MDENTNVLGFRYLTGEGLELRRLDGLLGDGLELGGGGGRGEGDESARARLDALLVVVVY